MTNEPSPRPWRVADPFDDGFPVIRDANERQVATLDGETPDLNTADAALIVDAVNERAKFEEARMEFPDFRPVIIAAGQRDAAIAERDRLRDIVRRLVRVAIRDRETLQYINSGTEYATEDDDAIGDALREARAAIGEDAK